MRTTSITTSIPKVTKRHAGRTAAAATPLVIRSTIDIEEPFCDDVRRRLAQKIGKHARYIERVTVRFDDEHGAKGRLEVVCRIDVGLSLSASLVVEKRAADSTLAFRRAADVVGRDLHRSLRNALPDRRAGAAAKSRAVSALPRVAERDDDGSLIGRRVGHAVLNLERALARPEKLRRDAFVDTAAPRVSASDRRVGYGATAARNTKRNTAGMHAALEDSRTTPSRKSTRRSVNRIKSATPKQRTTQLALHAPTPTARRAKVRKNRPPNGR